MPQSLSKLLVHLVTSTKDRRPFLTPDVCPELYAYIAAIVKAHDCHAVKIGGVSDHIHILLALSKNYAVAKIAEEFKKSSSKWLKTKGAGFFDFGWQNGYGAFSVSQSQADDVIRYIETQEEHHRIMTFQEEYREFLRKYQISFDERYVWE
jgi:REP element-mobilizing transposase RayT